MFSVIVRRPPFRLLVLDIAVSRKNLALELSGVLVPKLGSFAVEGGRIVGLSKQALEAKENSLDVIGGGPLVLEDVKANAAGEVEVGVVDGSLEQDGRRSVRVIRGESHGKFEGEASIRSAIGALNSSGPG